jgi:basic membrane lipoprotein Med (substrate-binding protein (PBP1-ABC) superfamily)
MKRIWHQLGMVVVASLAIAACGPAAGTPTTETKLVVGAIHVGSIKDAGYNEAQHSGLVNMQKKVSGIKIIEAENVPEGPDAERVMENMIQQGAKVIFPQSFGYLDFGLEVAKRHPDVKFEHPAGYKSATNFGTYWAASHDLSYMLGMAAGKMTKTNKLGFIGGFPIPQILATVNAFHLGARSVNPNVTTRVVFNGTWVDPGKEATATNALADQGVDVVTMVVDSPITVVQTAEKRGMFSIGYHSSAVAQFAPKGWINGISFEWGDFFARVINDVLAGSWKSENVVGDLASNMVTLTEWGKNVPDDVKRLVEAKKQEFLREEKSQPGALFPFRGPVSDQQGTLRIKTGEVPGPELINTDDWLAQGVIGQTK